MASLQRYERSTDRFQIAQAYVGKHIKLLAPDSLVVVGFVVPETGMPKSPSLAKRMLLELHTKAGLPQAGLVAKLKKTETDELRQIFQDNFTRYRNLGVEYHSAEGEVEFYGHAILEDAVTMAEDDFHLYSL